MHKLLRSGWLLGGLFVLCIGAMRAIFAPKPAPHGWGEADLISTQRGDCHENRCTLTSIAFLTLYSINAADAGETTEGAKSVAVRQTDLTDEDCRSWLNVSAGAAIPRRPRSRPILTNQSMIIIDRSST